MDRSLGLRERIHGLLLGTAVGDSLGLPAEGISRRRGRKLFPGPWRHRLFFGRGMVSDDTEHAIFSAQCLLASPAPDDFARRLAWCLRWWLVALPAGVGLATLRSIVKLWSGIPPERSGVDSAGAGPAMRSAIIGAFHAGNDEGIRRFVAASTRLTHRDPRALIGAQAVASVAAWCVRENVARRPSSRDFRGVLRAAGDHPEWNDTVDALVEACERGVSVEEFAGAIGCARGVSGYILHVVPVALLSWYRHFGDFEATLSAVLDCGGDTDTAGSIAGALAGTVVGERGIPTRWIAGLHDWPRGAPLLAELAGRLARAAATEERPGPVRYFWPGVLPRNLVFLLVVLAHGFRRLAPPY
ncbi:MAG: ADP-ribosylglycohydrolase family protein [Planctomycetota bacterium]|nr:ADP-ribosylglycohydrolase family protein [Planctomycetota bacterium]